MFVLGTAGHVDHGKSTLVEALTGMDPDRLPEEKRRGMTTDLGFAWFTLPSGREVSVVDVPGHARYIKNMLAGAGAIDLALVVVAADEGPMPQTREHLAILDLLGVPAALFVLTKVDRVTPDFVDLVEAELEELVASTPFRAAPRVRTSAKIGVGLDELRVAMDAALDIAKPRLDDRKPRLSVDRVFSVKGFGTVVTGTLVGGRLDVGAEIELQPGNLSGRVRGLQRHGAPVASADAGTRLAVNIIGQAAHSAERGMVLARPGAIQSAITADIEVRVPLIVAGALRHNEGITMLSGTAEAQGRLRLIGVEGLGAGEHGWAQVVLETPLAMAVGDRFALRTPNETVAGGTVLAVNPRRHRRSDPKAIAALAVQSAGSLEARLLRLLESRPQTPAALVAELGDTHAAVIEALSGLTKDGSVVEIAGRAYAAVWLDAASGRVVDATGEFLRANPLRPWAPREHVRGAVKLDAADFEAAIAGAITAGELEQAAQRGLRTPSYEVVLPPGLAAQAGTFLSSLRQGGYSPPTDNVPEPALLAYLTERGLVADTGAGVVFDRETFDAMVTAVRAFIEEHGAISLAETRDLFGTTRKYAQAFLEHLDALRITRRTGERRTLLAPR